MQKTYRRSGFFVSLILLVAIGSALWQRQAIFDWLRLRGYQPSSDIAALASDTTMNDKARRLFYVYHPEIESKTDFSSSCSENEFTIVLGCYVSGRGIYLYDVTDSRLNGVEQVTSAHELLHAAYERLESKDRAEVTQLILNAYKDVTDPRIRENIENYRKAGANTTNELHSILGTEVASLPPALENYYKRYFTNRAKIVAFSRQYESAFTQRQRIVEADDAKLAILKPQIEALESSLKQQLSNLNAERARMNSLIAANNYDDYNDAVPGFNNQVTSYNQDVAKVRSLIDQYNAIVAERNASALEENELIKAIDSRPDTVTGQ